jgi:NAD(P)-dependent dehydrogenase (short-subunit alcohol dehydrogenase family)
MQIKNSVFLVTGGASGLGAASARMAAENGAKVVIADLNADLGEKLAKDLGGRFVKTDVSSEADGKAAVALAVKEFGGLQVLVNCAGIALAERTLGKEAPHDLGRFQKVINVNVIGTFNMIRLAADAMAKASPNASGERGVIVNTASVAAYDGQIGQAAYSASKGGIVGMTLPIARDRRATASASAPSRRASSRRRCSPGCRRKRRTRSASRCRSPRASAARASSPRW